MAEKKQRRTRTYDAARTREAILDAAEEAFAELGYSAARIDKIAQASGYNKSLIYQYFGDKLGLYTEVIKRADQIGDRITGRLIERHLKDASVTSDAESFKGVIRSMIEAMFDFLLTYPRYRKILYWEAADEWKTWNQISYRPDDITQLFELAAKAKQNGIIRQSFDPVMFPIIIMNLVTTTIQSFSRFEDILGNLEDPKQREHTLNQIVDFVTHGMIESSCL